MSSLISVFSSGVIFFSLTRCSSESSTADSVEPVKTDITAGGASWAPSRCEFDCVAIEAMNRTPNLCAAMIVLTKKARN